MNTETVSLADVARRTGVQRPAVSNWKRRHPDFPDPLDGPGGELYDPAEIAAWLDGRRIPVNALRPGEPPGTTFGDRFGRTDAPEAAARQKPDRQEPEATRYRLDDDVLELLGGVRDFADPGDNAELVLALLCCRVADPSGWERFLRAAEEVPAPELGDLFRRTWRDLRHVAPVLSGSGDPPVPGDAAGGRVLREVAAMLRRLDPLPGDGYGGVRWGPSDATRLCERVLDQMAESAGRRGGEFHTPGSVVRLMAGLVAPAPGERVHDPSCGAGELLAAAVAHASADARPGAAPPEVTGVSVTERGRRLAVMNILVHGLQADIRAGALDAVRTGQEGGPVDVVITNPPFNVALGEHARHHWRYGPPPPGNANFAWLQHALAALSDAGRAAVITANGATFSRQPAERSIRAAMIEDGAVDCVVALPPGLFASTAIPVSLWILCKGGTAPGGVLLVDASGLGETRSRSRRRLGDAGIRKIVMAYRGRREGRFEDEPGFARHVAMDEIRAREHSLSPPAYLRSGGPAPLDTASTRADVGRIQDVLAGLRGRAERVDEAVDRLLRGEG